MVKSNNAGKYLQLRQKYPFFIYKGFDHHTSDDGLKVQFHFSLSGQHSFHPTLIIPSRPFIDMRKVSKEALENLLFNIGMVEMISYWKAACSPEIRIECGNLGEEEVKWWKKLFYNGLGEFRYLNSIETGMDDFLEISCSSSPVFHPFSIPLEGSVVIPIGGGKDSAVTLELLSGMEGNIPLVMNPRRATAGTLMKKGYFYDSVFEISRTIDPLLLELNSQGFLNGHTPFSALLAFVSLLAASLSGKRYIALSNESSANESTVAGSNINHQYSKSVEFEGDFRWYYRKFINPDIEYFSFLRPLNELQIAGLFSSFPTYLQVFRSCNAGSKSDSWCGKCPKCLFTYIILSPFIGPDQLESIFGKNLLNDPGLLPVMNQLTGTSETKPFDCIGTIGEVNAVLAYLITNYRTGDLPFLLKAYRDSGTASQYANVNLEFFYSAWDREHFLPSEFEQLLKSKLDENFPGK